jgi:hypothetical protein
LGNIDRYPTYKGGKVTGVVVYANYIGLRWFYQYVVHISKWSPYEGGQLDRFHCIMNIFNPTALAHTEEHTLQAMDNSQKLEQECLFG